MAAKQNLADSEQGGLSVEVALFVPVVIAILFLIVSMTFSWRLEGAVHRSTAALADVLANQRAGDNETMEERLDLVRPYLNSMFLAMVTGEKDANGELSSQLKYGIAVTYYNTVKEAGKEQEEVGPFWTGTMQCQNAAANTADSLKELGTAGTSGSLITSDNYGGLSLVRVDACVSYTGSNLSSVMMPGKFSSSFIAVRREE